MARPNRTSPMRRPLAGRLVGGVAAGLADNLGYSVKPVRWAFVVFGLLGPGLLFYIWLWLTVPSADSTERPPALARLAPYLTQPSRARPLARLAAGLGLLGVAGLIAATGAGLDLPLEWILPGVVLLAAVWLAWSQLDKADPAAPRGTFSWIRLGGAIALVVLAVSLLITRGSDTVSVVAVLAAGLAVLAGVALVLAPWGLRLLAALGDQRAATAREAERADIAAHLHDSVLQTLAVIRSQADDPAAVRHLARAQERELREWLYQDRSEPGQSTAAALRTVAGEVEDLTTVEIGVVVVGDHRPNEGLSALVAATREALLNAARHGAAPVSLYAEFSPRQAEVFVRDRGEGFDLTSVPADRLGVRESILGRVRRHGGHAEIRSGGPGQGTEVCLRLALTPPDPAPTAAQEQVSPARKAKPSAEERVSPARKDKP